MTDYSVTHHYTHTNLASTLENYNTRNKSLPRVPPDVPFNIVTAKVKHNLQLATPVRCKPFDVFRCLYK